MPIIKVQTSFNIEVDFEAAEFYRRLGAWFIDFFIEICYLILASKILDAIYKGNFIDARQDNNGYAFQLLLALPCILYPLISEILLVGQSVGKKIMRIRVVNENGGRASIGQYIIRWLIHTSDMTILLIIYYLLVLAASGPEAANYVGDIAAAVGFAFALLFLDIILVASSKKSQRLGDMLAGTILIRTNPKGSITDTVFLEVADNYVPVFPQIMQLSDRDINSIKSILDTSRKKGDFELAAMATEKIKNHLKIESSLSPFDFLEIVMKDYNYLSTK
jgi:uncharacterized RDD family membrane protein YckC